jgi:hypothetical protein
LTRDGWAESCQDKEDGLFHITAEDWDADAFLVVLNIFHVQNRKTPRTVSLETLAKIAVVVDYYECHEAVEIFTAMWIKELRENIPRIPRFTYDEVLYFNVNPVPTRYCRDLVLWLSVSWIFDLPEEFKKATLMAIRHSHEDLRTLGLPIPSWVSSIDTSACQ